MMRQKFENLSVSAEISSMNLANSRLPVLHPIYFGQCAEDYVALSMLRALAAREALDLTHQRYLEIGANHPVSTSATYLLHIGLGMNGVLVDANPNLIKSLREARPNDVVVHTAVSIGGEKEIDFYISDHSELSSLKPEFVEEFPHADASIESKVVVPALGINDLIEKYFPSSCPVFLSIDVEGMDVEVFDSIDLDRHRPYLVQIETSPDWDKEGFSRISGKLTSGGYLPVAQTDVNLLAIDARRCFKQAEGKQAGLVHFSSLGLTMNIVKDALHRIDVLSFDVFDTLLIRNCVSPTDVFHVIERQHALPGFAAARIAAEAKARLSFRGKEGGETSLEEIYSVLRQTMDLPDDMAATELKAEARYLYANSEALQLVRAAREMGKRIIAVSDIYLSANEVRGLLTDCGVFVDKVYTSSDARERDQGKYNGELYPVVCAAEGVSADRVLHIGDNLISDVVRARDRGVGAFHLQRSLELSMQTWNFFPEFMRHQRGLTSSVVVGTLNRCLASGRGAAFSQAETFGYSYAGPLLAGFVKFIVERCRAANISQLLLLARDGVIVGQALDILRPSNLAWRVLPASRRMTVFPLYADGHFEAVNKLFADKTKLWTQRDLINKLMLQGLVHPTCEIGADMPRALEEVFDALREPLRQQAQAEKQALLRELKPELDARAAGRPFAWVDVGWALTSISALNQLIKEPAPGFFVGSHAQADPSTSLEGYLFERGAPSHVCDSVLSGVEVIELIFTDTASSVAFLLDERTNHVQTKSNIEKSRDDFINEVRRGALEFMKDVHPYFNDLDCQELREYNRGVFSSFCAKPPQHLYALLAQIPHDREAGASVWKTIGDYWRPSAFAKYESETQGQSHAVSLKLTAKSKARLLSEYVILEYASKMTGLLTTRVTDRFKRSAEKRAQRLRGM